MILIAVTERRRSKQINSIFTHQNQTDETSITNFDTQRNGLWRTAAVPIKNKK